jgi:hypothetical protein
MKGRVPYVAYLVGDEMFYAAPSKGEKSVPFALVPCKTAREAKGIIALHAPDWREQCTKNLRRKRFTARGARMVIQWMEQALNLPTV